MPCRTGYEDDYKPSPEAIKRGAEKRAIEAERESNISKYSQLEKEAFGSFMSVFLCKAMKIIDSNNLMHHTYSDMEWWWKEHNYRDEHNNEKGDKKTEERLIRINNYYKVK